MKNLFILGTSFLLLVPVLASAQLTDGEDQILSRYLNQITDFIFSTLLPFLLAIAFIAFAWGVLKYFIASAEDDKSAAKSLMLYGIGGFVLILVLFGLVNLLVDFLGLGGSDDNLKNLPKLETTTPGE